MTRQEFAAIMAYLAAGCGRPLADESMEVYFDLLGDLPFEVLKTAAKRVILQHPWATFPSIAELREAAAETMQGQVKELSPAEAWDLAWRAASVDLEQAGPYSAVSKVTGQRRLFASPLEHATEGYPPALIEAMRAYGIAALCYGKEPVGVVRGQFMRIYADIAAREKRLALLPASVKRSIAETPRKANLPATVAKALTEIGKDPGNG